MAEQSEIVLRLESLWLCPQQSSHAMQSYPRSIMSNHHAISRYMMDLVLIALVNMMDLVSIQSNFSED